MTADDPEDLAVSQARDTAALAREVLGYRVRLRDEIVYLHPSDVDVMIRTPQSVCTWGDDAWHRAVSRLIRLERKTYRRLLAEERERT